MNDLTGAVWRWLPDAAVGGAVLVLGFLEVRRAFDLGVDAGLVILAIALAVGLSRAAPAVALGLVWTAGLMQVMLGVPVMLVQLSVAAVAFGAARWGRAATAWAALISMAGGSLIAALLVRWTGVHLGFNPAELVPAGTQDGWWGPFSSVLAENWLATMVVLGGTLLGVPWLAGAVLRVSADARAESERAAADLDRERQDRAQAEELARVREEQSRLARDVHDVVGHSLAVILAQAQAGEYLPDDDPAALKRSLATIARSARGSLRAVRQVLSDTSDGPRTNADLDRLIEDLRADGHPITLTGSGAARPLPPEQAMTAFRVLQEMLTNAIRHGRRGRPIEVRRDWDERALVIATRNPADAAAEVAPGHGLDGMRQRVAAAGGHLDVAHDGEEFRVTARIPVPA